MRPSIVFPGSFDPMHPGHLMIIVKAYELGYNVEVLVANNPNKNHSEELLKRFHNASIYILDKNLNNVRVNVLTDGDTVPEWCERNKIENILRGIRNKQDIEYELELKKDYLVLNNKLKFVYVDTGDNTSSSVIRERKLGK